MTAVTADTREGRRFPWRVTGRWVGITGLLAFLVAPIVPLFIWSISFRWFYPAILPTEYSARAWTEVITPHNDVLGVAWNTALIALVVTAMSILLGVPAGRALGLYEFRGKRLVEWMILAPIIVPGLAVVLGIHVLFIRAGLSNSIPGVILVHLVPTLPYMTLVMSGVFANYDTDFELQARSLGASRLATQLHITLPAIFPGVVVGALFAFIISWSQYVLTLLIGGGQVQTLPLLLFGFVRSDPAIAGALSVVFILPAVIVLLLSSRYLSGDNAAVGGIGNI
ncbi:MAG: ABC transporter permease [bacterium]|nr:ABC transporter permease [bacterium]MDE0353351.1 ABC transporter permease [bacterium]